MSKGLLIHCKGGLCQHRLALVRAHTPPARRALGKPQGEVSPSLSHMLILLPGIPFPVSVTCHSMCLFPKGPFMRMCSVAYSYLTLCDPMDCGLPGSSVHGILQARILEWVATAFSSESSRPRDRTQVSGIAGRRFTL